MKPIDSNCLKQLARRIIAPHGCTPVRTFLILGGSLVVLAGGLFSGCGNAQINWARLVSNLETSSPNQTSTQQPGPTITERKVQTGFGQGVATASGVMARIWIRTGTSQGAFQDAGAGVSLRNVTIK